MKTLKTIIAGAILSATLVATPVAAKEREGLVTAMEPIENRSADETEGTKKKKSIGTAAGGLFGTIAGAKIGGGAGAAVMVAAPHIGRKAGVIGDDPESTQYMVTIKLDSGKTLNLARYRVNLTGVEVGTRVTVSGKGSDAVITPVATQPAP